MIIKGIDVSSYQGNIDWKAAAEDGVEFAILKIMMKDLSPDAQFEKNWCGCMEAGIPVQGVYNYSYATTEEKAISDAKRVLSILGDRKPMVWLDIEDDVQKNIGGRMVDIIKSYERVIREAGLMFGVYTGLYFYNDYIRPYTMYIDEIPFWISRYPTLQKMTVGASPSSEKKPYILNELWAWQYSSKGTVKGIKGYVDLNELYVDVKTSNIMPEPEKPQHKVGEEIRVSSYYNSSVDPIEKAIIKENRGTILRIAANAKNPYCFGKNGIPIGWCNDGDIRETVKTSGGSEEDKEARIYKVKAGDTLGKIAKAHHTTVDKIVSDNKRKHPKITPDFIMVGWELTV